MNGVHLDGLVDVLGHEVVLERRVLADELLHGALESARVDKLLHLVELVDTRRARRLLLLLLSGPDHARLQVGEYALEQEVLVDLGASADERHLGEQLVEVARIQSLFSTAAAAATATSANSTTNAGDTTDDAHALQLYAAAAVDELGAEAVGARIGGHERVGLLVDLAEDEIELTHLLELGHDLGRLRVALLLDVLEEEVHVAGAVVGLDDRLIGLDDARHLLEEHDERVGEHDTPALLAALRLHQRHLVVDLGRLGDLRAQVGGEAAEALVAHADERKDLEEALQLRHVVGVQSRLVALVDDALQTRL